jgi:putative Holliday junction resolvase
MIMLALDVGQARIGVATCDDAELLASPRSVIRRTSNAAALDAIVRLVAEAGAGMVVVGLPISFDGQLHGQAQSVQAFAEKLRHRLSVPLEYADETLSTWRAEEMLRASGVRRERIRERIDAAAAAVILQDYLDQRHRQQRTSDETQARDASDTTETMYGEGGA